MPFNAVSDGFQLKTNLRLHCDIFHVFSVGSSSNSLLCLHIEENDKKFLFSILTLNHFRICTFSPHRTSSTASRSECSTSSSPQPCCSCGYGTIDIYILYVQCFNVQCFNVQCRGFAYETIGIDIISHRQCHWALN